MKTIKTSIAIAISVLTFSGMVAQNKNEEGVATTVTANRSAAAELINYQAVARNAGGALMTNAAITIDFEIRNGAGGSAVFNETQSLTTDANGVFSAQIGAVTSLEGVNWAGLDPWLQVKLNGTNVGETQMASVPGALYSKNSGSVMIYGSGSSNANKMIIQHSPALPNWGIEYDDVQDKIGFLNNGFRQLSINLNDGTLQTYGHLGVFQTTTTPALNRIYGNSVPVAFGKIATGGSIVSGYGITSVTRTGTGIYLVTLDISAATSDALIPLITPNTASGAGEITGFNQVSANSFEAKIFNENGAAKDSAFSVVIFANQ
ncbi:hypothetical protein [Aequorivita lipolytica]|uniref:Uncharacterized protein n=1 Tax=Aequorivita lipolytica TaxID=153267 RepID=A0A5C6YTR7_9FLAO|nr:hypothetical protein [Aequorivita lipolytica]TXD70816.1 hypothetical protein ESV24_01625 [Aequorivita lipolytica]SRX49863.1 hypothetical protein AEQU2_00328 [Aequorivita lipolytica]